MNMVKYSSIVIGLTVCIWAGFAVLIILLPKIGFGSMIELSLKMSQGSPLFAAGMLPKIFAKDYNREVTRKETVVLTLICIPILAILSMFAYALMARTLLFILPEGIPLPTTDVPFFIVDYPYLSVSVLCSLMGLLWMFPQQVKGWVKRLNP